MGPDRLDLIEEFVTIGKSFIMAGGWNSFQGIKGIPGYHDTVIEEILPVEIKPYDDRVEKPQGVYPEIVEKKHPIFIDLPEQWPQFLGYNQVILKENAHLLARINNDPFIATAAYGKGRTVAFTSDLSKHWGTAFIAWNGYAKFWCNTLHWLTGKS